MKFYRMVLTILLLAGFSATASHADKLPEFGTPTRDQFQDYWYNHGAELSRFSLRQMRYGEIHEGDAVLVFVTEKMNPDTQIKADHPGAQDIAILKLNAVRKGIFINIGFLSRRTYGSYFAIFYLMKTLLY